LQTKEFTVAGWKWIEIVTPDSGDSGNGGFVRVVSQSSITIKPFEIKWMNFKWNPKVNVGVFATYLIGGPDI